MMRVSSIPHRPQGYAVPDPRRISIEKLSPARAILAGGLIAGVCDITFAITVWGLRGATPIQIGQAIMAGLVGRTDATAGGIAMGLAGLALHFVMTLIMAAIYFAAASRLRVLVKHAVACGVAYGLAIYAVMNYVVIPLSAIGPRTGSAPTYIVVSEVLVHMFLVGLPIAVAARAALK